MANSGGREGQSSLLFFHKIHCGTMSIYEDKYLTPSQSTSPTRSPQTSQYCRPLTCSDALKYSFSPRTSPHLNSLAPSVVAAETTAYGSMVRPLLEYCSTVWNTYTHEYVHKLEMVQKKAARYVTIRYHNTSSLTSMLDHLEWESLETRRTKHRLIMLFKIVHGLVDIPQGRRLVLKSGPAEEIIERRRHERGRAREGESPSR